MYFRRLVVGIAALAAAASGAIVMSSVSASAATPTGRFTQVSPTRIVDTRSALGAPQGPLAPEAIVKVQVTGAAGVPADATAVAVNLTLVEATKAGFAALWSQPTPGIAGPPSTSSVNASRAGQTVANMSVVSLSYDGSLNLYSSSGGQFLIDVAGYWTPAAEATAGRYISITPVRALDTRTGGGVAPGGVVEVNVTSAGGLPAGVGAVAVTITGTMATAAGFVTAWASGASMPNTSSLNLPTKGATVPNLAIVPVGANGKISLFTSGGTQLIVDIAGYFTGVSAAPGSDGLFVPIQMTRIVDTRSHSGMRRLAPDLTSEMPVAGLASVPAVGVASVALNLTVTNPLGDGYLSVGPSGAKIPVVSNLNFVAGDDVAGLAFARLGANGKINVGSYAATNFIADVAGYFTGAPAADTGFHPLACENAMLLNKTDIDHSVVVRDRTGAVPDRVIAGGAHLGATMGPNCDYIVLFQQGSAASTRLVRLSMAGRSMGDITELAYSARTISSDGTFMFFATGANDKGAARYISRVNVYSKEIKQIFDGGGNYIYDIENVDETNAYLRILSSSSTTPFADYLIPTGGGQISPEGHPFGRGVQYVISPHRTAQGQLNVDANNSSATAHICSGTCVDVPDARWISFTAQDEAVVRLADGRSLLFKPQFSTGVVIPQASDERGFSFPTYA